MTRSPENSIWAQSLPPRDFKLSHVTALMILDVSSLRVSGKPLRKDLFKSVFLTQRYGQKDKPELVYPKVLK
jgi:hypothetical protein